MVNKTRIVVMGDPHIQYPVDEGWDDIIADVNSLEPVAVFIVGDLTGYGPAIGTKAATWHAKETLDKLDAPWFSVIGNHDMEAAEFPTDEAAVASFLSCAGRETPWFRTDVGPFSVLGLSTTSLRRNSEMPHEVVFETDQLDWLENQLVELANHPVFVIAHVPPIGSGLLTMAELHVQVGNAVVNQNHCPGRIMNIIWRHPNILAWFSGHNHLGQCYRDAMSVVLGVHFVHVGVAGKHTRDGFRHSRVVDIHPDFLDINTYDHAARCIGDTMRYREPHSLRELLGWRNEIKNRLYVERDCATMRQGMPTSGRPSAEPGQDAPSKRALAKGPVSVAKARLLTRCRAHGHLPRVVAHRGLSGACPENTLPAFAAAVALGADEIELDLWASRDGELVVCHDPDVDRTSDGHGLIRDLTWPRIRELDAGAWYSPAWAGTRFCRLDEVLDAFGGRVLMNVHIKEPGQDGLVVRRVRDMAAERGLLEDLYIAGDTDVLEWAVAAVPDVSRCSLAHPEDGARMVDSALKHRCARVQFWNPNFTAADVARAHEHGIACNLFFGDRPDTPDEAVRLCKIGLDAILTNWTTTVLPAVRG